MPVAFVSREGSEREVLMGTAVQLFDPGTPHVLSAHLRGFKTERTDLHNRFAARRISR